MGSISRSCHQKKNRSPFQIQNRQMPRGAHRVTQVTVQGPICLFVQQIRPIIIGHGPYMTPVVLVHRDGWTPVCLCVNRISRCRRNQLCVCNTADRIPSFNPPPPFHHESTEVYPDGCNLQCHHETEPGRDNTILRWPAPYIIGPAHFLPSEA
jgi:hypothetical protein